MSSVTFEMLQEIPLLKDYQEAFFKITGVPLKLLPAGEPPQQISFGSRQNLFCQMMTENARAARTCRATEAEVQCRAGRNLGPETGECFAGLHIIAAPVVVGGRHIANLVGGQVLLKSPTPADFERFANRLAEWGYDGDLASLEAAFFGTNVIEAERFEAMRQLLNLFAQQLGDCADRSWTISQTTEPRAITQAKAFLHAHLGEPIRLAQVAAAAHLSRFHFSRMFRSATGVTLTDYIARLRVDRAKQLLGDASVRVSEVAFATGFSSISQFNTVFRKTVGQSPTQFRNCQRGERTPAAPTRRSS